MSAMSSEVGSGSNSGQWRMGFPSATQAEIMRAAEKDEHYAAHVCDACHEAFRHAFGTRQAVSYQNETKLVGGVLYYLLTTGSGLQTLGEEYCDIAQADGSNGIPLTPARRILLVFFQTVLPYLANRISAKASSRAVLLAATGEFSSSRNRGNLTSRITLFQRAQSIWLTILQKWHVILPSVREVWLLIARANLMLFYFEGTYYHLAKRASGVHYIFTGKPSQQRTRYHMLGMFLLIQLCIMGGDWLYRSLIPALENSRAMFLDQSIRSIGQKGVFVLNADGSQAIDGNTFDSGSVSNPLPGENVGLTKCSLCLSPKQHPTSTPCGHVFCWNCVVEWCNEKPECPLCRSPVAHSELVCIYHADI